MKNMKNKSILTLAMMVLLLTFAVGGTIAYIVDSDGPVVNTFEPAKVTSDVEETFANNVKTDVKIRNTGNTDAFIRAAIVVTWKDAKDKTMAEKPVLGTDYSMSLDLANGWSQQDGFYYWNASVAPNGTTGVLITRCVQTNAYEDGRKLCVEIIGSAIQSTGIPGETYLNAWTEAAKK